ncbi:LolA family protein [Roseovarius nanhaiticus]|uniref:Outer membrane lipoprotein-sorting protein n=1 Tax=Roseovarius nanhaiticus TaxID=573024 RepID=A0A1N7F5Y6_9RHOB|nr:outer membrane lipoprotein carrier protein LolA [Roseovarius nanhaiticus]SEK61032.1 Outer membrane lipoprotein-sorting protein [Roseovarius nanhaiticus]SIR95751.1 Outer membrane lipoprotein-sorting protein [Roseovarius nanhaiticus]
MPHIRTFLAALILVCAGALPAAAQKLPLSELSRYLNSFQTASGAFTQINDDGTISEGRILIKRPGRVRFEYKPPEEMLVVANGDTVGIIDGKSNEGPQGYPLNRTPLSIILARNVDFTRARMVTGHSSDGTTTTVRAQDPDNPDYGSIDLVFTSNPTELRQWVINDSGGSRTTVILGDLTTGVSIDNSNFVIPGIGTGGGRVER